MEEMKRYLEYDLQWFAKDGPGGEKTEPATAKKLRDAREEGKVAKSKEFSGAVDLIVLFLGLKIFGSDCPVFGIKSIYIVCRQGLFRRIFSSL